jgi:hypothetical protein
MVTLARIWGVLMHLPNLDDLSRLGILAKVGGDMLLGDPDWAAFSTGTRSRHAWGFPLDYEVHRSVWRDPRKAVVRGLHLR